MLLVALAARLSEGEQPRRVRLPANGARRPAVSLRSLFNLSSEPRGNVELAARVVVLVGLSAACYCLGMGARLFVEQAPMQAAAMVAIAAVVLTSRKKD